MDRNTIFELIKTNDSEVEFIKDDMKITFWLVSSDISMGYIFVNGDCIFSFTFSNLFKHISEDRIYFTRNQITVFSWNPKGFKLVPKEI